MYDVQAMVGVGLAAFASTNTDNLLLMAVLLGRRAQRPSAVLAGYIIAVASIAVAGLVAARLADAVPGGALGYLGIIPLSMGLVRLYRGLRGGATANDGPARPTGAGALAVAAIMLSNGSDTLAVLLPLFAETPEPLTYVLAATVVVAAGLWFAAARWIASHAWVAARIERLERWFVPLLLIGLGVYILMDTGTDVISA